MATLHENTLKFNAKMTVTNTGGNLSTDAGLVLVKEFLHSIGFEQLMEGTLDFPDDRLAPTHLNESILEQLIFQLTAGYDTESSANILRHDPFFQQMLEKVHWLHNPQYRVSGIESVKALMRLCNSKPSTKRCWIRYAYNAIQQKWCWIWIQPIVTPTATKRKRPSTPITKQPVIILSWHSTGSPRTFSRRNCVPEIHTAQPE